MRRALVVFVIALWLVPAALRAAETGLDWLAERFMEWDSNGDGMVSEEEFMDMVKKRAQARFAAMDRNGDGQVTEEEFRAFWRARKAEYYRLRH